MRSYLLWLVWCVGCGQSGLVYPQAEPCVNCWDTATETSNSATDPSPTDSNGTNSSTSSTTSETPSGGTDADGDGFVDEAAGGDDCDDGDPTIYPGAEDICEDTIDQDCDGADALCQNCGNIRIETRNWGNENTYLIAGGPDCSCLSGDCSGGPFGDYSTYNFSACWTPGGTCQFQAIDSLGDGWHGGTYRVRTVDGSFDYTGTPSGYGEVIDLP